MERSRSRAVGRSEWCSIVEHKYTWPMRPPITTDLDVASHPCQRVGRTATIGSIWIACSLVPLAGVAQDLRVRSTDGSTTDLSLAAVRSITFTEQEMTAHFFADPAVVFPIAEVDGLTYQDISTGITVGPTSEAASALQVLPNPVTERMELRYVVSMPGHVMWEICDTRGQVVYRSPRTTHAGGQWTATWDRTTNDGRRVEPGMYICKLNAGTVRIARSFIIH